MYVYSVVKARVCIIRYVCVEGGGGGEQEILPLSYLVLWTQASLKVFFLGINIQPLTGSLPVELIHLEIRGIKRVHVHACIYMYMYSDDTARGIQCVCESGEKQEILHNNVFLHCSVSHPVILDKFVLPYKYSFSIQRMTNTYIMQ